MGLDLKSGVKEKDSGTMAVKKRMSGRVSRPEMWSQTILDKTGSRSKQAESGTKGRLKSLPVAMQQ